MLDSLIGPGSGGAQIQPKEEAPANDALGPLQAVAKGEPPAVFADLSKPTPAIELIANNLQALGQLGLQLYRGQNAVVLFNPQIVPPETVKQADQTGQLASVAAPLDSLLSGEGSEQAPAAEGAPEAAQPSAQPTVAPAPAQEKTKLSGLRIKGLMDNEAPSDRPAPGQGKILNGLLKRAV